MDDRRIAEATAGGDAGALAAMYDAHATWLYTYCRSLTGEDDPGRAPDAWDAADPSAGVAAEALCDTVVVAARYIRRLRDPDRLRTWLYALARWQCLVRVRHGGTGSDAGRYGIGDRFPPPGEVTPALAQDALRDLEPPDREVLELTYRHGLDSEALATVLGVSRAEAGARLASARARFEGAVAALVAPGRAPGPSALAALLGDLPPATPPASVRGRALQEAYESEALIRNGHVAVPPLDKRGFPLQPGTRRSAVRRWALAAAAAVLVVTALGAAGGSMLLVQDGDEAMEARAPSRVAPQGTPVTLPSSDVDLAPIAGTARSTVQATPDAASSPRPPARSAPPPEPATEGAQRMAAPEQTPVPTPRLVVTPARVDLGSGDSADVRLSAEEGAVLWGSAASHAALTVSPESGALPEDGEVEVTISLDRGKVAGPGQGFVRFTTMRGQVYTIAVTWR